MLKYLSIISIVLATTVSAAAYSPDSWASASVMSEGKWVKISVSETGMHLISLADLRSWGFSTPSKVRVYGYGGRRISDLFTEDTHIDDLPMVQSELTSRGIVFYGVATDTRIDATPEGEHYYVQNPYSTQGYYFLSDREAPEPTIPVEGSAPAAYKLTTFVDGIFHEVDEVSPIQSGHILVGEDFRFTPTRQFRFQLPDKVDGTDVWMQCDFYAISSGATQLSFSANGTDLPQIPSDRVMAAAEGGDTCRIRKFFPLHGNDLTLSITAKGSGTMKLASLDNLAICYTRALSLPSSGTLQFTLPVGSPLLSGATTETRVWDVTSPQNIVKMPLTATGGGVAWTNDYYGTRIYVAWNENARFLTPRIADRAVANQNLHALTQPDMVIVTHPDLRSEAERVAEIHRADSMEVLVLTPQVIYNEFSSGAPDYNAFRKLLKMFYDRAQADASLRAPRYCLLMGGVSYDHRGLTSEWRNSTATLLPTWQTDGAISESYSYCSDDPVAFLEDNSGILNGRDLMCVAVGRIPARSRQDAKVYVDRLEAYVTTPAEGEWRNRVLLLADDGDDGIHQTQTETYENSLRSNGSGEQLTYRKVYLESYELQGDVAVAGREKLHSLLNDGVILWNYIGHSAATEMSSEGIFKRQDILNAYLRKPAFFYGATCSFVEWDRVEEAGLQLLTLKESGGLVGGIAAVRPVLINRNGPFTATIGTEMFVREESGHFRSMGEVLRLAKNRTLTETNKMRYVLLGDPAMRLAIPDNLVTLDSINGVKVEPVNSLDSDPVVVPAYSRARFSGSVTSADGTLLSDFNGSVTLNLYDAELSFTTVRGDYDTPLVADEQGERLFTGRAAVRNGRWTLEAVLPSEIADNYRPATMSLYARSDDATLEASGVNRDFYVYGISDEISDTTPPEIEYVYLNHETFRTGDTVNDTPMLLARVSDNVGLNMAVNGIGHQMNLRVDNSLNLTDIASCFIPDSDGSPAGTIAYQLPVISAGAHRGVFKVWDIAGNSVSSEFDFFVDPSIAPKIFDVYTDANPAYAGANFFISHNRPDAMLTVTVDVFDISGRRVWSSSSRGRADMFATAPLHWDLTDSNGGRVGRGIYLYRATVTTEATSTAPAVSSSEVKRIAVAPM
ncbi:MAG: type IX secretion system sortase PorU [Muribaculaceae bacterium]|nr:type IX secretion system sortase PorU [Muribaculaceae bacterium]